MAAPQIEQLIHLMSKIPGFGPRSARRAVLHLMNKKEGVLIPLITSMQAVADNIKKCPVCGNMDTMEPCSLCSDIKRDESQICVVQDIADLWALERVGLFKGKYHVLGGVLSAIDGIGPQDLSIADLVGRIQSGVVQEVILALPATVDGQTTAHYVAERLEKYPVKITTLSRGVPVGGELDYLDDGTLQMAFKARRDF
ncbi:MAG: recombination protein RecR [Alphaproteobacteria bacterium]|nr:recombination protein RecR [Alphaproteobacteria bacterium]